MGISTCELRDRRRPAGDNLAPHFKTTAPSVWELALAKAVTVADQPEGMLTVSIKDKEGNVSRIERSFSVAKPALGVTNDKTSLGVPTHER